MNQVLNYEKFKEGIKSMYKGTLNGEDIHLNESNSNITSPHTYEKYTWLKENSYVDTLKEAPFEIREKILGLKPINSIALESKSDYNYEGIAYRNALILESSIGPENTKILCAATLFDDMANKNTYESTNYSYNMASKHGNWIKEYFDINEEKVSWICKHSYLLEYKYDMISEDRLKQIQKDKSLFELAIIFSSIKNELLNKENHHQFIENVFRSKNIDPNSSVVLNGYHLLLKPKAKTIRNMNSTYENVNVMDTILDTALSSVDGIKKYIIEHMKINMDNRTIDDYKEAFESLIKKDFEGGYLNEIKYEKNLIDFYHQNYDEIDDILDKNKWIRENKSKWRGGESFSDLVSKAAGDAIALSAKELYEDIF